MLLWFCCFSAVNITGKCVSIITVQTSKCVNVHLYVNANVMRMMTMMVGSGVGDDDYNDCALVMKMSIGAHSHHPCQHYHRHCYFYECLCELLRLFYLPKRKNIYKYKYKYGEARTKQIQYKLYNKAVVMYISHTNDLANEHMLPNVCYVRCVL